MNARDCAVFVKWHAQEVVVVPLSMLDFLPLERQGREMTKLTVWSPAEK